MRTNVRYCVITIAAVVSLFLPVQGRQVSAGPVPAGPVPVLNNGDVVKQTNFSQECPGPAIGVGIAFDGKYLWYSCYATGGSPDLFKADPTTGDVAASFNVAGGLGALAWDGRRKELWAGWGGGAGSNGDIRLIDPTTGTGTVQFNATQANQDYNSGLDDGLAYDAQDDSLYVSPDVSQKVYHYTLTGSLAGSFPWAGNSCYNSGVAIGGDLLFEGSDGCNHIWVVKRSDHSPAFDFPTGSSGVRDEGMACDSVTFSPQTVLWSVEAYSPRRAVAYHIPSGSCATGGGVDTDNDGLLNEWETGGVTIDPCAPASNCPQFIDLPSMGADPNKQDIFLQIDWMQDATHNQKLSAAALKKIHDSFAAHGINIHIDEGPNSIMDYSTGQTWGSLSQAQAIPYQDNLGTTDPSGNYDWGPFQVLKDKYFTPTGRTPIFHFVIAAHNYGGGTSSGISRDIPASDLIVSLGSFTNGVGTVNEQSGTLMHELGHNLGLRHGGGDDTNYKPNYLSIMNYSFQMQGLIKNKAAGLLDYSGMSLPTLDESHLNETTGLGALAAGYGTIYSCNNIGKSVLTASGAIDWNCDGTATDTDVAANINNLDPVDSPSPAGETLTGFNDWANLNLKGGAIGLAGISPVLPSQSPADKLTPDVEKLIPSLDSSPPTTTATLTPVGPDGKNGWYVHPVTVTLHPNDPDGASDVASTKFSTDGGTTWNDYTTPLAFNKDGSYNVLYYSTDVAGNRQANQSVTFKIDQTAPTVTCVASPALIWPPNHKMVPVNVTVKVADGLSGPNGFILISATSSEPNANNDIQGFVTGAPSTSGFLRAERSGGGNGRIYTLTYQAMDMAGNTANCAAQVKVRHDQGHS
ncbi:MAG: hypothetical protein NVSMB52_04660 [Chloroflexota bacterium]